MQLKFLDVTCYKMNNAKVKLLQIPTDISRCRHQETRALAWTLTNAKSGETTATSTPFASINPAPTSANASPDTPATDALVPVGLPHFDTRFYRINNVPNSRLLSFSFDFQGFLTCKDLECGLNAECLERPGVEAACRCSVGFQGNGYVCRRLPENDGHWILPPFFFSFQQKMAMRFSPRADSEESPDEGQSVSGQISEPLSCVKDETICDPFASCIYDYAFKDYKCRCRDGYVGDGIVCIQREEGIPFGHPIPSSIHLQGMRFMQHFFPSTVPCNVADNCSPFAVCTLDVEKVEERIYVCICLPGYVGDGYSCTAESNNTISLYFLSLQDQCI